MSNQRIAAIQTHIQDLPSSDYVIVISFPSALLYYRGQLIGSYAQRRYAADAAGIHAYNLSRSADVSVPQQ